MKKSNHADAHVFNKEEQIIARARQIVERNDLDRAALFHEYGVLCDRYRELLNTAVKLTNLGDRNQRKLIRLKDELHRRNEQIERQKEELERLNEKLEEASLTDALTGLRNRRFLTHYLDNMIPRLVRAFKDQKDDARGLLFLMLDIDRFKLVNDTYGHDAGDRVLQQFARRIRSHLREGDLVARIGGEEFLAVATDADRDLGAGLAEKLRSAIESAPFTLDGGSRLDCTCSIGFACFPFIPGRPDLLSWQQTIRIADLGLYAAKKSQRNAWIGLTPAHAAAGASLEPDVLNDVAAAYQQGLLSAHTSLPENTLIIWS